MSIYKYQLIAGLYDKSSQVDVTDYSCSHAIKHDENSTGTKVLKDVIF